MKSILAHHIILDGADFRMSVARFSDDFSSVEIFPFRQETAGTVFVEGTVIVRKCGDIFVIEKNGKRVGL